MLPALLLIDLQNDFLDESTLAPTKDHVVRGAANLLGLCRSEKIPVAHIWTTVREDSDRMPHWRRENKWACVEGSHGHATPELLKPDHSEKIIHKKFFSAFTVPDLKQYLVEFKADTLILCGVHTHACIQTTAVDAYSNGYSVLIAEDAVASFDPEAGALARRFMHNRIGQFLPFEALREMLHNVPSSIEPPGSPPRRVPDL